MKFQGMLEDIDTRAHPSYKDMNELDFQVLSTDNYFVNLSNIHLFFPMKIKKSSDEASDIDDELATVNNFFAHLIKEISVLVIKNSFQHSLPIKIYQYSDSMLKHLPKDTLKKLEKALLNRKQSVYFNITDTDRRTHDGSGIDTTGVSAAQITTLEKITLKI